VLPSLQTTTSFNVRESMASLRVARVSKGLHTISEALMAKFVGMEDALITSMGFATNSTYIPTLVGKGFKHNDMGVWRLF